MLDTDYSRINYDKEYRVELVYSGSANMPDDETALASLNELLFDQEGLPRNELKTVRVTGRSGKWPAVTLVATGNVLRWLIEMDDDSICSLEQV